MERIMSVEEKIRRAEQIYERRKQGSDKQIATVSVNNEKKDIRLLKKMIVQILICISIYYIYHMYTYYASHFHYLFTLLTSDINLFFMISLMPAASFLSNLS